MNRQKLIELMSSEELSDATRADIAEAGEAVIPVLVDILRDKAEWEDDGAGEGWASVHAATLLGEMSALAAVQPLLDTLAEVEWETYLANAVTNALAEMGPEAVEPTLAAYAKAEDTDLQFSLCEVLTCCGAQDERIFALLTEFFGTDPDLGATLLSIYGDARALPMLAEKLAQFETENPDASWVPDDLPSELAASIVELGGTLTSEQHAKLQAVLESDAYDLIEDDEEEGEGDDQGAAAPEAV